MAAPPNVNKHCRKQKVARRFAGRVGVRGSERAPEWNRFRARVLHTRARNEQDQKGMIIACTDRQSQDPASINQPSGITQP